MDNNFKITETWTLRIIDRPNVLVPSHLTWKFLEHAYHVIEEDNPRSIELALMNDELFTLFSQGLGHSYTKMNELQEWRIS